MFTRACPPFHACALKVSPSADTAKSEAETATDARPTFSSATLRCILTRPRTPLREISGAATELNRACGRDAVPAVPRATL
jgi:hypothetical protein